MVEGKSDTGVYIKSARTGRVKTRDSLLSNTNNKSTVTQKISKKIIVLAAMTVLILLLSVLLVLAVVNGWLDRCDITLESDTYKIEEGIMTITGSSENPTLRISKCKKINSIVVSDKALQSVSVVEIFSIVLLLCLNYIFLS